jgi:predicted amino acid-binding ACT domain protein
MAIKKPQRKMKKYLLVALLAILLLPASGQTGDSTITKSEFKAEVVRLSRDIGMLRRTNSELASKTTSQASKIDSLQQQLATAQSLLYQIADSLKITVTNASSRDLRTQAQIQNINQTISKRTLTWIIGILVFALASVLAFFMLRNKLRTSASELDTRISKTRHDLEAEAVNLDAKLIQILQTQLVLRKEERKQEEKSINPEEHKLPLKVGEEIHRMKKRIGNMPGEIKGLTALNNSLKRLEEEFNDNGYEMEDLLGSRYVDGMKVEARFVDNPDIPKGQEIITDVLRPQIKYKGEVIQIARVEVGKSN